MSTLLERLIILQNTLPSKQQILCKYILEHSQSVYLMTVGELSEKSGVGRATIMRLIERLQYDSYQDFKKELNQAVMTKFESDTISNPFNWQPEKNLSSHSAAASPETDSLSMCFHDANLLLQQLEQQIDREQFAHIIDLFLASRRVNVLGLRSSSPISRYASYILGYFLENVRDLSENESMVYDWILNFRSGDIILILGCSPITSTSVRVAKLCHEKNIPIIAIVDSPDSPVLPYATASLCTPRLDNTRLTIIPMITLLEALFNEIGIRTAPLSVHAMNRLNKYIIDEGIVL